MEINASIDVGDNITGMLERLAAQIGTTADKVFPWYAQQAILEGVTALAFLGFFWIVFIVALAISFRKADFDDGNRYAVVTAIAGIGIFFCMVGTVIDGADSVRKIMNPNYYAMKMMTQDIGRLVHK